MFLHCAEKLGLVRRCRQKPFQLGHEIKKWQYFPHCRRQGNILSLNSAERSICLKLTDSVDGKASIRNNVASPGQHSLRLSAVASGPTTSRICINMALKALGNIRLEDDTLILGGEKIFADPFHSSLVGKLWTIIKPGTLMSGHGNVRPGSELQIAKHACQGPVVPRMFPGRTIHILCKQKRDCWSRPQLSHSGVNFSCIKNPLNQEWLHHFEGTLGG